MKNIVFKKETKSNLWIYENIHLQEIEDDEWMLTINNERQVCDTIYEALSKLAVLGFNVTFRVPKEMENINPMNKCD